MRMNLGFVKSLLPLGAGGGSAVVTAEDENSALINGIVVLVTWLITKIFDRFGRKKK